MLRVARDVVGEREADDERRERPDHGELERLEEDVAVEVEVADEVVPEVAVVVERPGVGDVGEADDLAEARRRDERERQEEEEQVPGDRRKREPARIARADGAGARLLAPALGPFRVGYRQEPRRLRRLELRPDAARGGAFPLAETLFVSSFFSVAAGGNTIGLFMMLFGRTVLEHGALERPTRSTCTTSRARRSAAGRRSRSTRGRPRGCSPRRGCCSSRSRSRRPRARRRTGPAPSPSAPGRRRSSRARTRRRPSAIRVS